MYSIKQAAELLGIPARVVRRLVQDGLLPGVTMMEGKHGRPVWRLAETSVQALRQLAFHGPAAPSGGAAGASAPAPWHTSAASPAWDPQEASLAAKSAVASPVAAPRATPVPTAGPTAAQDAPLPWPAVQLLLAAERDRAQTLAQTVDHYAATIVMLRQTLEQERDEVVRLRHELTVLRDAVAAQQHGEAQRLQQLAQPAPSLQRKGPPRLVPQELQDRPTEPIDLDQFRQALAQTGDGTPR
jgi:excisionase family DNA binding protein